MAKQEKELTVEERLRHLYDLQEILSKIDGIKTLRGELPLEVQDLEDGIAGLNTRVENFNAEIASLKAEIANQQSEHDKALALIDKYTADQDHVRNNIEYDYLNKEIEYQKLNVELADKRVNEATARIEAIEQEVAQAREQLADNEHVLDEKKTELNDIISETKQKEEKFREQAKKLESKIDARLLGAFKRIRKNVRNGLGLVYVQRNACGGCFNRIPPQRQMEIKMHKKLIVCEYCGRILIDPAIPVRDVIESSGTKKVDLNKDVAVKLRLNLEDVRAIALRLMVEKGMDTADILAKFGLDKDDKEKKAAQEIIKREQARLGME